MYVGATNMNKQSKQQTLFENTIQNIPTFVFVCNAAGPLTEDNLKEVV